MACYAAKETGRNRIQVYSDDDADLAQRHGEMQWVSRIKTAIEENHFILYRQSIVPLQDTDNKHSHYEYLLRMVDTNDNIIMPNSFLPAAERFDLMTSLDKWVVTNVFKSLSGNTVSAEILPVRPPSSSGTRTITLILFSRQKGNNFSMGD